MGCDRVGCKQTNEQTNHSQKKQDLLQWILGRVSPYLIYKFQFYFTRLTDDVVVVDGGGGGLPDNVVAKSTKYDDDDEKRLKMMIECFEQH